MTNLDDVLSRWLKPELRVKGDNTINVTGKNAKLVGQALDDSGRDITVFLLYFLQDRYHGPGLCIVFEHNGVD